MKTRQSAGDGLSARTADESVVLDYLRLCDRAGAPRPRLTAALLSDGRWFAPCALPDDVCPLPAGQCHQNIAALVAVRPDLRHVVGLALAPARNGNDPWPLAHAWAADREDRVVDPTWASTPFGLGLAYFGVFISNLEDWWDK